MLRLSIFEMYYNTSYNVSRVCENTAKFLTEYYIKKKAAIPLETQKTPPI